MRQRMAVLAIQARWRELRGKLAQKQAEHDPFPLSRRLSLGSDKLASTALVYLGLIIAVNWVPTKEQIADLLTKPLDKTTFLSLRTLLMTGSNEVP